jgi:ABC-type transporter Mla MlaB component
MDILDGGKFIGFARDFMGDDFIARKDDGRYVWISDAIAVDDLFGKICNLTGRIKINPKFIPLIIMYMQDRKLQIIADNEKAASYLEACIAKKRQSFQYKLKTILRIESESLPVMLNLLDQVKKQLKFVTQLQIIPTKDLMNSLRYFHYIKSMNRTVTERMDTRNKKAWGEYNARIEREDRIRRELSYQEKHRTYASW